MWRITDIVVDEEVNCLVIYLIEDFTEQATFHTQASNYDIDHDKYC